jgi:hypothetical protein
MADKEDIKKRVKEDEDYIRSPKFSNSLAKFLAKNPDGAEDSVIARLLSMSEEEVEAIYQEAVNELREEMKDGD